MEDAKPKKPGKPNKRAARSAARLAAVQALYQMDIAGTDAAKVIVEFSTVRAEAGVDGEPEGVAIAKADKTFFAELVRGVVRRQADIDPEVDQQLAQGWRLARVDSILRQILRTGLFELMERTETPPRVVISEYIEISKDFFTGEEPRVANGVLDRLARKFRADDGSLRPEITRAVATVAPIEPEAPSPETVATPTEPAPGVGEPGRKTLRLPIKAPAAAAVDAEPEAAATDSPAPTGDDDKDTP